jgi:hypothetical protein
LFGIPNVWTGNVSENTGETSRRRQSRKPDTGSITLGHRESSIPFSYYDDKQQVIGYSHELMLKVVDAIKADLKLAKLDTKLMPVTSPTASPWSRTAPSISSAARPPTTPSARSRSASRTPSSSSAPADDQEGLRHQGLPDLAGKNVVTTAGTTSERLLRKMNEDKQMKMNIISRQGPRRSLPDPGNRPRRRLHDGRRAALRRNGQGQEAGRLGRGRHRPIEGSLRLHAAQGRPGFKKVVDDALPRA